MRNSLKSRFGPARLDLLFKAAALCFFALGSAFAQSVAEAPASGTMKGTLDGVETEWRTVVLEVPDGEQNTASFTRLAIGPVTLFDFTIQGHQGNEYVKNALALSFGVMNEAELADCPCEIRDATASYWTTESMFGKLYGGPVTLVIEKAVKLDDDHYSLEGSFSGSLVFMESAGNVDEDDILEVDVTFAIERVDGQDMDLNN